MKKLLLPALLFNAIAAFGQWQNTTNNTAQDVTYAFSKLFASTTSNTDIQASSDNGATWTTSNTGVPASGLNFGTLSGSTLYGYKNNTVFSSTTGNNWTSTSGIGASDVVKSMTSLTGTVYAATSPVSGNGYKIFTLNGTTWSLKSSVSGTGTPIVTVLRNLNGNLFAATTNTGVLKSTNGGTSFSNSSTGIPNNNGDKYVSALGATGSALFLGTSGGKIMRSTDNGANWSQVYNIGDGMFQAFINDFYILSANNILVATDSGFVYSTNGGTSWNRNNVGLNFMNFENYMKRVTVSSTHIVAAVLTMSGGKIVRRPLGEIFPGMSVNENAFALIESKVYPNPANTSVTIEAEELMFEDNCSVKVIDALGREVGNYTLEFGKTSIDLSSYSNGIYSFSVLNNKAVVSTGKLVKN